VLVYFLLDQRKTDRLSAVSGVDHARHNQDPFRFRGADFYSKLKPKVENMLTILGY
jgi:hypothetical protein